MSYQAYLDNVKAKTGKAPDDFRALAKKKGFTKHGEVMTWLKSEFELGHGHATAIAHEVLNADKPKAGKDEKIDKLFSGKKEKWRAPYDALMAKLLKFGDDVGISTTDTYVSLLRGTKKFGIVQPSAAERFDIGIKLKGTEASGRFEDGSSWNAMVTHRVRITDPKEIDAELFGWLKKAYNSVK